MFVVSLSFGLTEMILYRIEARHQTPITPLLPDADAPSFRGGHDLHSMSGSGASSGEGIMFREFYFYVMSPIYTESSDLGKLVLAFCFPMQKCFSNQHNDVKDYFRKMPCNRWKIHCQLRKET